MIYITGDTHADFLRLYRAPFSHIEELEQGTDRNRRFMILTLWRASRPMDFDGNT